MGSRITSVLDALRSRTSSVIVGTSGGKDSVVTLDLCVKNFKHVEAYFYYLVPGLSFQEEYLHRVERRYGIKVRTYPHWALSIAFDAANFRPPTIHTAYTGVLNATMMEARIRKDFGIEWIATGERAAESLQRLGMLTEWQGIRDDVKRAYPIAFWPVEAVRRYIRKHRVPMGEDAKTGRSFAGFGDAPVLRWLLANYPDDYKKLIRRFPHAEAVLARDDFARAKWGQQVPDVQDGADASERLARSAIQSAQDRAE